MNAVRAQVLHFSKKEVALEVDMKKNQNEVLIYSKWISILIVIDTLS